VTALGATVALRAPAQSSVCKVDPALQARFDLIALPPERDGGFIALLVGNRMPPPSLYGDLRR
jgi:hypothetical protein